MQSVKNTLSAAGADLGLGDVLQADTEAQIEERRRKLTQGITGDKPGDFGAIGLGQGALMSLGLTPAH